MLARYRFNRDRKKYGVGHAHLGSIVDSVPRQEHLAFDLGLHLRAWINDTCPSVQDWLYFRHDSNLLSFAALLTFMRKVTLLIMVA